MNIFFWSIFLICILFVLFEITVLKIVWFLYNRYRSCSEDDLISNTSISLKVSNENSINLFCFNSFPKIEFLSESQLFNTTCDSQGYPSDLHTSRILIFVYLSVNIFYTCI